MDYITVADVRNKTFSAFSLPTKQMYVDLANAECEDLAIKRGIDSILNIVTPVHYAIKEYLIAFAVKKLAIDNADFNNKNGDSYGAEDKYDKIYNRQAFDLQSLKGECTLICFTGGLETPESRATYSQRIVR